MIFTKEVVSSYPWGPDELSQFLKQAEENTFASSFNLGPEFSRLADIHALWVEVAASFSVAPDDDLLAIWFLHQSNSAWLAALRIGMGGQVIDAQPLLRSCIEYAAYALHFTCNPPLKQVWLNRHDNEHSRKKSRAEFGPAKVKDSLRLTSSEIAARFELLYETTIDFGGHPNERGLSARLNIVHEDGAKVTWVTRLTDNMNDYLFLSRTAARAGVHALEVFERVFETRFRIASFDARLKQLQRGL
jgi:hypothetical protein